MWANRKSIQTVVDRNSRREPPYCPSPRCEFHRGAGGTFRRHGRRSIQRYPYVTYRFLCLACGASFSDSFFSLSYRDRLNDQYEEIFDLHCLGVPKRGIARMIGCSEEAVRRKIAKLARWSILRIARDVSSVKIREPIAYDGLENFAFSQYDPNNLNHAIGKESFFTYDFNLASMNRKGRMSERQKKRKRSLEEEFGKYPKGAIHSTTKSILERLLEKSEGRLEFHSDNHYAYREVIAHDKKFRLISHKITPAKLTRNYRNRLFPVNHLDLLTRQKLAAFKRETIAFSKTSIAMLEGFAVFAAWKNYCRSIFEKEHVRDNLIDKETPAMRLGITKKRLTFAELFRTRITSAQVTLHNDWAMLFQRIDPTSRRPIHAYQGI
jgi:hypothetical protein